MKSYVVLLRGINVGGKNKIPMAELKLYLEELGFSNVSTYIQSGNVLLQSTLNASSVGEKIEKMLPLKFKLDSSIIRVLVLTGSELGSVVNQRPAGFGDQPNKYHSDAIFLMGISADEAIKVFDPRDGVDKVWPGDGVIYSQRLSTLRTKSRLSKVMGTPAYRSMTIRNWNTTLKLVELVQAKADA